MGASAPAKRARRRWAPSLGAGTFLHRKGASCLVRSSLELWGQPCLRLEDLREAP